MDMYLTLRPELAVIGLAVIAVLGVFNACSIDCDVAAWVAGRTTPVTGLPLKYMKINHYLIYNILKLKIQIDVF